MPFVIQIDAWDTVAAAAVTLRLSSVDDERVCHLNAQTWLPAIDALPTLAMDFFGGEFGVVSTPRSSFSMMTSDWPNFGQYAFVDARMRMWQGDAGAAWGSYVLRFDGRISADPEIEDQRATLSFGVDDRWLDQPLLATYAGTGGIEGRAEQKGAEKPLALGAPQGVPGVLLDPVKWIYQLHAYGAVESVDVPLERLARQFGSVLADYASYAALDAAAVPAGQWATCKASGLVRMGAPPYGKLCFLMRGDKAGPDGWVRRPGAQIKRIADIAGYSAKVHEASVDALDTARPYDLSLYFGSQQTVREAVQSIAASVNAVAGVSLTGELIAIPVGINAAAMTLRVDGSGDPPVVSCKKLGMDAPWWRLSIGAQPFWLVHGDGDYVTATAQSDLPEGILFNMPNLDVARQNVAAGQRVLLPSGGIYNRLDSMVSIGDSAVLIGGFAIGFEWAKQVQEEQPIENAAGAQIGVNLLDSSGNPVTDADLINIRNVPPFQQVMFQANYQGVIDNEQLPKNLQFERYQGNVFQPAAWSIQNVVGIDAGAGAGVTVFNGIVNIPDTVLIGSEANFEVRSDVGGVFATSLVSISKTRREPPLTSKNDANLLAVSTAIFEPASMILTVSTGALGKLMVSASIDTSVGEFAPEGVFPVELIARWRTVGGVFADIAIAVASAPNASVSNVNYARGGGVSEVEIITDPEFVSVNGLVTLLAEKTGLAASVDHEVQLFARRTSSSPAKTVNLIGTFTVEGK